VRDPFRKPEKVRNVDLNRRESSGEGNGSLLMSLFGIGYLAKRKTIDSRFF